MTVEWHGKEVLNAAKIVLDKVSKEVAENVEKDAKRILKQKAKTTTEKGLLSQFSIQESKFKDGGWLIYCQGPGYWYPPYHACVLGFKTYIKTDKGFKNIGLIRPGDFVIGQDGLPHKINFINSFYATEKPDLVELQVEFIKTRNHVLTITTDHKILTFKNGVSYWIKAGELKVGDFVFAPIKKAHNKESAPFKKCLNCERKYQETMGKGQGKKFCSSKCRDEYYAKGNNPHTGMKRSKKTCLRISKRMKELLKKHPEKHINVRLSQKGFQTDIEKKVEAWLLELGLEYKKQFKVGRHFVDFMIPSLNLLLEADGAFWHKDQTKDIKRDKNILSNISGMTIIHIHFADKRFTPELDNNPIENVFYIQCNNSMNSFVNLDYFKPIKIIKKTDLKYMAIKGKGKKLYDLSVESVHSFIASGIIISNSFFELGTYKQEPKPFMRPAKERWKRKANKMHQEGLDRL